MLITRIALLLFTSVFVAQWPAGKSSEVNSTATTRTTLASLFDEEQVNNDDDDDDDDEDEDDDEVDEALENMDFAEFKERYRRLIQYRTYFVASNYLNSQVLGGTHQQHPQNYERDTALPTNPLIRKPQRLIPVGRPPIDPSRRKQPNGRPSSNVSANPSHKHEDKFVPSVQYDPKEIGGDTDFFTPVKYSPKLNYDKIQEYSATGSAANYERAQQRPPIYQEIVASVPTNLRQENGYYSKERAPVRATNNNLYLRKYINKQKAQVPSLHQDYLLDYGTRTSNNNPKSTFSTSDYSYPVEDFESVRYVNIEPPLPPPPPPPPSHPKPTRILAQSLPRQPSPLYSERNPAVNINDIMKSLQLTNRLPEMLNKDNIDSSIKTLVEILSILNNAKQNDYQKLPVNHVTNAPVRYVDNNYNYKHYTRPKVVTETRFQATPRPPVISDGNIRYEDNYEANVNYVANKPKQHHIVEYYTPLVQDIDEIKEQRTKTTERPQNFEDNTEHTYEITEDLADDILQQEKYSLPPPTTEVPVSKFQLPDGVSMHSQLVPPTTLKYGATRGKPNVDYPAYAAIPETEFNCKEQRYKGFFGDPSTGCQVWHYCDLNGGKSSFLCPNGTIFSQVALTCDWWFNVQCESTTQLYVLNERLYKYILPIMPKFPEDFSGPEVDRYLELKFKEMEAKLKEKKLKKLQKAKAKAKLQALQAEK